MPQKCCVPNCRGNYRKTKEHAEEKVSVFRFPSDPELHTKWVRMIPREGLEVCDKTVVCEKHFLPEFVIRVDTATRADGSTLTVPRKNPKLAADAYPCLFPNNSSHLSSEPPKKRKSPAERFAEQNAPDNEEFQKLPFRSVNINLMRQMTDPKCDIPLKTSVRDEHFMNIADTLVKYREHGVLCDAILVAKCGRELKAHSALLAAVSPVFLMTIEEKSTSVPYHLCFPEVELNVLEIAVHFVYTGKLLLPEVYSEMDQLSKLFNKLSDLGLSLQKLHECEVTFVRSAKQTPNSSNFVKTKDTDSETNLKDSVQELQASCKWPVDKKPSSKEAFNEEMIIDVSATDATTLQMRGDSEESSQSSLAEQTEQENWEQEWQKRKHKNTGNKKSKRERLPNSALVPTGTVATKPVMRPACSIIKSLLVDLNIPAASHHSTGTGSQELNNLPVSLMLDQNTGKINTLDSDSYGIHETIVNDSGEPNPKTQRDILNLAFRPNAVEKLVDKAGISGSSHIHTCEHCKGPNAEIFTNEIELLLHKVNHHWNQCTVCNYCGLKLSTRVSLKKHLKRHLGGYPQKKHKCNDCGLHFISPGSLKDHRLRHTGEKPHECPDCRKRFMWQKNMERHQLLHTGSHPFLCDFCGKGFTQKNGLANHVTIHHEFECALCSCKQTNKADMEKHAHEVHQISQRADFNVIIKNPRSYLCDLCGKNCISARTLRNHMQGHRRKPVHCETCGKTFSNNYGLQFHMRRHTGEKPFVCDICQKGFARKSTLMMHLTIHSGIKPFACVICSNSYASKGQLKHHMNKHTMTDSDKKRFKCAICNNQFTCKTSLIAHHRIHTGERPYNCIICSKQFMNKSTLTIHIRSHTGDKPFSCTVCEMSFAQSPHLSRHMRTHTGEKPFLCEICSKSYKQKIDLRYHLMRFHKIDVTSKSPLVNIDIDCKVKVPDALHTSVCIVDELKHELDN